MWSSGFFFFSALCNVCFFFFVLKTIPSPRTRLVRNATEIYDVCWHIGTLEAPYRSLKRHMFYFDLFVFFEFQIFSFLRLN